MPPLELKKHSHFLAPEGPVVLVVMDGVAIGPNNEGNAVALANTPTLDRIWRDYPTLQLAAHGLAVGMPSWGDMGNSEVGHNAIGAGRVFNQGAKLVNQAIATGKIFEGEAWRELIAECRDGKTALHLIGLLSDGNVHSHIDHLFALIGEADRCGIERLFVHPLLDGRDVAERSALSYLRPLEALLEKIRSRGDRTYHIASGGGRMLVTMDRYFADWRIVERGYHAHVHGRGREFETAEQAISTYYNEDPKVTDQFLPEFVIHHNGSPVGPIGDGDSVIFFNFRGDRAIEISMAFEYEDFSHFDRGRTPQIRYAGMMRYDGDLMLPKRFLVLPPEIDRTIGEYLSCSGVAQLAVSETQKFGHVTYFWNGNRSGKFDEDLETYIEIPSDRIPFEQAPRMKAKEITDVVIDEMRKDRHRFIRLNYANCDMVGHTGVLDAAIEAVETVDHELGRLIDEVLARKGIVLVTADHGNSDEMFQLDKKTGAIKREPDGKRIARTSHTLNPVPFTIVAPPPIAELPIDQSIEHPMLSNIAATVLLLLGFEAPEGYDPALLRTTK